MMKSITTVMQNDLDACKAEIREIELALGAGSACGDISQAELDGIKRGLNDVEQGKLVSRAEFWRRYAGKRNRLD